MTWLILCPSLFQGKLGELLLSLCYEPNIGRLTVIVIKAKDLKAKDITGASGGYDKPRKNKHCQSHVAVLENKL